MRTETECAWCAETLLALNDREDLPSEEEAFAEMLALLMANIRIKGPFTISGQKS